MDDEEKVVAPDATEEAPEAEESEETQDEVESVEQLRQRLQEEETKRKKAEEVAKNQRIRAEKAEERAKGSDTTRPEPAPSDTLSTKDLYALMGAKVPEEDVDEVVKAAKLLNVSVAEALKDDAVQAILRTRLEHRTTANATNTKSARPSAKRMTDEEVLRKANAGELPEPGTPEAEQLFRARHGGSKE